jgi:hypothetical protein
LIRELQAELEAKKKIRDYTIIQAFCDRQVLWLIAARVSGAHRRSREYLLDTYFPEMSFWTL